MPSPIAEATAYLEKLEVDRRAAIAIAEEKAGEAKLITARQEGFRTAMKILAGGVSVSSCESQSEQPRHRRPRRDISQLILRELSFSGQAMTISQIAKAIDYIPERTETALKRLEMGGKVVRNETGRWAAAVTAVAKPNGTGTGAEITARPLKARHGYVPDLKSPASPAN